VNATAIHGLVEGEISITKERADIHLTGKLFGNIFTPIISVNEGGILEGHCKMGRDNAQKRRSSSPWFKIKASRFVIKNFQRENIWSENEFKPTSCRGHRQGFNPAGERPGMITGRFGHVAIP